jgi:uncharacterized protein
MIPRLLNKGGFMQTPSHPSQVLSAISAEVQARFASFEDLAHGWEHVQRVYYLAAYIAEQEHADLFVVTLAALLHDLGRTIRAPASPHAERSALLADELLAPYQLSQETLQAILHAILAHSYRKGVAPATLEACVLYDADRLDSLGASGILRWAMSKGRRHAPQSKTYHPDDPFATHRTPDEKHYVLDEFFSKFLTLDEAMTTRTGRVLAQRRIAFLRLYLQELQRELEEGSRGKASLEWWLTAS